MRNELRPARILTLLGLFAVATLLATAVHFSSGVSTVSAALPSDGDDDCRIEITKTSDDESIETDESNESNDSFEEDEDFTWTLEIDWDDDCSGVDIEITDNIPNGFDVLSVSESGASLSCNNSDPVECDGEISGGPGSADVDIRVRADGDDCGTRTNTGRVTWDGTSAQGDGSDSDSDSVRVNCDDEDATIRIVKDTNPEDANDNFSFEIDQITGGNFHTTFSLGDDESRTFNVESGVYVVSEDGESGWDLIDINCSGSGSVSDENHSDNDVRISVGDGESVTCTFVNERDARDRRDPTPVPPTVSTPVVIFIPPPPQPVVQPAPPVSQVQGVQAPAPQPPVVVTLPRTGEGPTEKQGALLPVGIGLLVLSGVGGLTYWRMRRSHQ
jgi:hypothetical protein